jgi:hypothetical protein
MEHPNWNRWLNFFSEVTSRGVHLNTLIVDWEPRPIVAKNWVGRMNRKKEDEFLGVITGMKQVRLIKLYGEIPSYWKEKLGEISGKRVIYYPFRWWREPGMDP